MKEWSDLAQAQQERKLPSYHISEWGQPHQSPEGQSKLSHSKSETRIGGRGRKLSGQSLAQKFSKENVLFPFTPINLFPKT